MSETYKSEDKSLSFNERVKLAAKESETKQQEPNEKSVAQKEHEDNKRKEANDIMDTVEKFVNDLLESGKIDDQYIKAVQNTRKDSRRKVVEVFTFNAWEDKGDIHNKTIDSTNAERKPQSTKYILSGGYRKLTEKYIPERSKTVKELLQAIVDGERFNMGIDPETGNKIKVCVFWKRGLNRHSKTVFI